MQSYAGADWICDALRAEMSPLGERVANLLGDLTYGIYHINQKALKGVDWNHNYVIIVKIHWPRLATTDPDDLTRLVFLAHDYDLRVQLAPVTNLHGGLMELMFHDGSATMAGQHPSLWEAVYKWKDARSG